MPLSPGPLPLEVLELGPRGGTPVVFVNGLGGLRQAWWPVQRLLARHRRSLSWNPRGIGRSAFAPLPRPARMEDFARDLAGLLDALGYERAVLVGISWGGRLAQCFARLWPERCPGLVLVATSAGGPPRGDPEALAVLRRLAREPSTRDWERAARALFGPTWRRRHRDQLARLARWWASHPQDPRALALQWEAFDSFDARPWLGELHQPALVVHGEEDALVPWEEGRELAERLPRARFALLPGVGHSPNAEAPERLLALLLGFLEELEGPEARGR